MNINENKQLVQKHYDAINTGDLATAESALARDIHNHGAMPERQGAEGHLHIIGILRTAFPDATWTTEDVVAEGDRVACRMTMRGTNTGPINFKNFPMPATGKSIETEEIHIWRVADGKLVEHWIGRDDAGVMRQLGIMPSPKA